MIGKKPLIEEKQYYEDTLVNVYAIQLSQNFVSAHIRDQSKIDLQNNKVNKLIIM